MSKVTHPGDNSPDTASGVSFSQVLAAGLASAGAAVLTSRFGVTGTLLGAALTTMIITGGSAFLKNYLERMSGHVQSIGAKTNGSATGVSRSETTAAPSVSRRTSGGMAVYGRRRSLFGGMKRRSVFVGALIPAILAFGIAIAAVTGVEVTGGRTLSCLVWQEGCQTASAAGTSSGSSTSLGRLTENSPSDSTPNPRRVGDQNLQQNQSNGSGFFGGDGQNSGTQSGGGVEVPEVPDVNGGSDGNSAIPDTGATPSDGSDTGTEVPDYETPSTGTQDGSDEQEPVVTPPSSRSSSNDAVPPVQETQP